MPTTGRTRGRHGGRSGNVRRSAPTVAQRPWGQPFNTDHYIEPLNEEGIRAIHDGAMRMLEEVGLEILHDEALGLLRDAGAVVDFERKHVRIGREIIEESIRHAPETFEVVPRNPERKITIGGRHVAFAPVGSAPNVQDLDRGRRTGNREDYRKLLQLGQHFNCIHLIGGYPVEPIDLHPSIRHLEAHLDKLLISDKVTHAYSLGRERVLDVLEMVRIASRVSEDEFPSVARVFTNINTNSPMKIDGPMMDGAMRCAERGQGVIITPFTLSGAMAPVTIAGAVTQQTAEALAGIAVCQLLAPGARCVYGGFVSNVDMKSGAPAFGTPEYMRGAQLGGQMARFYKLPYRASNVNASNAPDAQSVWESMFALWGVLTGGVNIIIHAAGWLEGGLSASYEKYIIDCEILEWLRAYYDGFEFSEDALGIEAVREVGPGGHFFGCAHTQERYENAFHMPFLSDWRNFETWQETGAVDATRRANGIWKQILKEIEPAPIDPGVREELEAFVAKRVEEGGAPTDF